MAGTDGKLPLSFVPNAGQINRRVRYYAQGERWAFYFTKDEATLALARGRRGVALQLVPRGANETAKLEPAQPVAGRVNYLQGSKRYVDLPTYRALRYREIWPGIDLVFRGQGATLKYELRLKPGANPADVRFAYRGAEGLSVGSAGDLLIGTPLGTLRDSRPRTYQRIDGRRVSVASRYVVDKRTRTAYGFRLGAYDHRRAVVIDPGLVYSTFLGQATTRDAIAVDAGGSAYVAGNTSSPAFPTTIGAFDTTPDGGAEDAFVSKLNASGSDVVYSTYLGGSGGDAGNGIAVDASGSAYVTGYTSSADFPTTSGALRTSLGGSLDAFVTKLTPSGSGLVYSTYLGGSETNRGDQGFAIALDAGGSAYVAGTTNSSDFPITFGDQHAGAFVTKLTPTGSALAYSTILAGDGSISAAIAVDTAGGAYVTGFVPIGPALVTTPGAFDTTKTGNSDAFAAKVDPSGFSLAYSTYLGGNESAGSETGLGVAVDPGGNAYVTGATGASNFPVTAGAFDTTFNGGLFGVDAFVTKLNAAGSGLVYSTYLGGTTGGGIAIDGSGSAFVTGSTGSDFPTTTGAFDTSFNGGNTDAFVAKVSADGASLPYSTYLGGSDIPGGYGEAGMGIALDPSANAYVTGITDSSDFPTTAGAFDTTFDAPVPDAFVTKLDLTPLPNSPPECASVTASRTVLTTANRKLIAITLGGATDPDGDAVTLSVDGVTQDEPVVSRGDPTSPDAIDAGEGEVTVRAERNPRGDGRVYRIAFTASDGRGGTCSGTVTVSVPRKKKKPAVDSAPPSYNSSGR